MSFTTVPRLLKISIDAHERVHRLIAEHASAIEVQFAYDDAMEARARLEAGVEYANSFNPPNPEKTQ